jgi:hypothetical protein
MNGRKIYLDYLTRRKIEQALQIPQRLSCITQDKGTTFSVLRTWVLQFYNVEGHGGYALPGELVMFPVIGGDLKESREKAIKYFTHLATSLEKVMIFPLKKIDRDD